MRILSMTATFGKLSRQTLELHEGLNIIEAPNEWGKSTWCAFLMAMLYGIDTSARSGKDSLADKDHYAPWSGEPMSGSMDILWNGRSITIQRQPKKATPMGEVKAFETGTGVLVPELCVPAPGKVLLGVEQSVFARAGFLRLSEMPVTKDEALRRRLNELVTTGDESGASDALEEKLNKLKNKCKHNKTGLIPDAEAQLKETETQLQRLQAFRQRISAIKQQQTDLEEQKRSLENHRQSLRYQEHRRYAEKLTDARNKAEAARQDLLLAQKECESLPAPDVLRQHLTQLQQLRDTRDALHTKTQLLPPLPPPPESLDAFRGKNPQQAVTDAKLDTKVLQQLETDLKKPIPYILGGIMLAIALAMLLFSQEIPAAVFLILAMTLLALGFKKQKKLSLQILRLEEQYRGIPAARWEQEAQSYAEAQQSYNDALTQRQQLLEDINKNLEETTAAIAAITGGQSLLQYEEACRYQLQSHMRLQDRHRDMQNAESVLQAISGAGEQPQPPAFPDTLDLSSQATEEALLAISEESNHLQQELGACMGEMNTLGSEEALENQRSRLEIRIARLEKYLQALTYAINILSQAKSELQRRFAPRISGRAQQLFSQITDGRYQRISLRDDLSVEAGAADEVGLRSRFWRSEGTVDQLYLALRVAVAEELTPEAPLVLDDALVRFDDTRLAQTLRMFSQMADRKQIILFTCQSREKTMQGKDIL